MKRIGIGGALFLLLYWLFKDVRWRSPHACGNHEADRRHDSALRYT